MKKLIQLMACSIFLFGLSMNASAQGCSASFTPLITGNSVTFSNTSSVPSQNVYYYWNFGDNSTSNSQSPTHTYNSSGYYYVCLSIVDSSQNCWANYCDTIAVGNVSCYASFSYQASTSNNPVYFFNNSAGGNIYAWDFGDATTSTAANPTHTYASPGTYNVCLMISNSSTSCTDTFCSVVTVYQASTCNASFTFTSSSSSNTVQFTNTSTGGAYYMWDFGDNSSSNAANPSHTYNSPGVYGVCLTIYDSMQTCWDTYCDTIVVGNPSCNAYFSYQGSSVSYPVYFFNGSNGGTNYYWDFGDATTSTSANPMHTYSSPGTYNVCLTITNSTTSCADTFCTYVTVTGQNNNCVASFNYTVTNNTVQFTNTSTGGSNHMWSFGDNSSSSQMSPSHTYNSPGTYMICLTVWDSTCQSSACDTITITPMSLNEISQIGEVNAYPNPFNDIVNISFELQQADDAEITVFDMLGNKVDVIANEKLTAGKNTIQWNASALSKGVYMLKIITSQGSAVKLLTRN